MNRKQTNQRRTPRARRGENEDTPVVAEEAASAEPVEKREYRSVRGAEGERESGPEPDSRGDREFRGGRGDRGFRGGRGERGERTGRDDRDQERMDKDFLKEMEMRIGYFLESAEKELELEPMNSYRRRMVHDLVKKFGLNSESRGEDRARYVTLVKTEATKTLGEKAPRLWDFGNQTFPVNPGAKGIRLALKVDGTVEIYQESEKKHTVAERLVTSKTIRIRKGKILQPDDPGY